MPGTEKIYLYDYQPLAEIGGVAWNCGIDVIGNLEGGPVDAMVAVVLYGVQPMFMFSDAVEFKHGERLARYIRRHKLGKVVSGPTVTNINDFAHHEIKAWFWVPDRDAVQKWRNKYTKETPDAV